MWHLSTTIVSAQGGTVTTGYQHEEIMLDAYGRAMSDMNTLYAHFTIDAKVIEQFVRKAPTSRELSRATAGC